MSQSQTRRPTYASRAAAVAGGSTTGPVYGGRAGPSGRRLRVWTSRPPAGAAPVPAPAAGGGGGRNGGGGGGRPRWAARGRAGRRRRPPRRKKRRDPLWARLLVMFGALLMLLSGGAIVGGKVLLYEATSGVEKAPLLGDAGAAPGAEGTSRDRSTS